MMDDPMIVDSLSSSAVVEEGDVSAGIASTDKENNKSVATSKTAAQTTSESSSSSGKPTPAKNVSNATQNKMDTTTSTTSTANSYAIPWVEKFRPRTLDDVLGNVETVIRLRAIAKDGNLPNLILCGPPGTGTYISIVVVKHVIAIYNYYYC
jgi:predicted ATPase with chaperone activity